MLAVLAALTAVYAAPFPVPIVPGFAFGTGPCLTTLCTPQAGTTVYLGQTINFRSLCIPCTIPGAVRHEFGADGCGSFTGQALVDCCQAALQPAVCRAPLISRPTTCSCGLNPIACPSCVQPLTPAWTGTGSGSKKGLLGLLGLLGIIPCCCLLLLPCLLWLLCFRKKKTTTDFATYTPPMYAAAPVCMPTAVCADPVLTTCAPAAYCAPTILY